MWKYDLKRDIYLCKSCDKIFEEINSKLLLFICPKCQKPICKECVKLNTDFCKSCMYDIELNEILMSINSCGLNNIFSDLTKC